MSDQPLGLVMRCVIQAWSGGAVPSRIQLAAERVSQRPCRWAAVGDYEEGLPMRMKVIRRRRRGESELLLLS